MRKLSLDLAELRVESFETVALARTEGTVAAHDAAAAPTPGPPCCSVIDSCPTRICTFDNSCLQSCAPYVCQQP